MRKIPFIILLCFSLVTLRAQEERPSVALVLGGGGARGFGHIAVLELLEEMNIPIDLIAGVSSGAIVGGLYAAGYTPIEILEGMEVMDWAFYFRDRRVSPFRNNGDDLPVVLGIGGSGGLFNPGSGYSSGQRVYNILKSSTIKIPSYINFDSLPIPFRAGVAEIPGSKFELLDSGDLAEAIRASMSIQGVFEPFIIEGKKYVDGGMVRALPVQEVREMGYDIIIAVDITNSHSQRELANIVLLPVPDDMSAMDFFNGRKIYEAAVQRSDEMAALLEPVLERISSAAAPVLTPAPVLTAAPVRPNSYNDIPSLIPQILVIEGALKRDRAFIEKQFSCLRGVPFDEENLTAFLDKIFLTGNYRSISARTDIRSGETVLELIFYPGIESGVNFRAGLDYEGTFSFDSSTRAALRTGLEFNLKNGSSFLLQTGVLDELSAGISAFFPINPYFFLAAQTEIVRDQRLNTNGFLDNDAVSSISIERFLYFNGSFKGGIRFNNKNTLSLTPGYFWLKNENDIFSATGVNAVYVFSSLDNLFYPSRGFYLRLDNFSGVNIELLSGRPFFNLASLDLTAAFPVGARTSLAFSGYGSFFYGETFSPSVISSFSRYSAEREFFPHKPGIFTGEKRAALSLSLRHELAGGFSLLGGRTIFSLTASAGRSVSSGWRIFADLWDGNIAWNVSLGAAVILLESVCFQLRAGVGGNRPAPFVALDIGMRQFRKQLF